VKFHKNYIFVKLNVAGYKAVRPLTRMSATCSCASFSLEKLAVLLMCEDAHQYNAPHSFVAEISFLRIPKMHLNMMYNLKSAKRILSCTVDRLFRATATFLRLKVLG